MLSLSVLWRLHVGCEWFSTVTSDRCASEGRDPCICSSVRSVQLCLFDGKGELLALVFYSCGMSEGLLRLLFSWVSHSQKHLLLSRAGGVLEHAELQIDKCITSCFTSSYLCYFLISSMEGLLLTHMAFGLF